MPVSFSVVIPTYNRGNLIAETLDSILAQTFKPEEVIIVDDGSNDDTHAVLSAYRGKIMLKTIENSGVQTARNVGIALARCDWIALCDSDDLWLPSYLEKQAALLSAEPGLGMSFANFRILRDGALEPGTKFDTAPPGFWQALAAREIPQGWIFDSPIAGATFRFHPIFPSATVVARTLALTAGGFNASMPKKAEDGEFTLRCLYNRKVAAIPEPLVHIRKHDFNVSRDLVLSLVDEISALQYIKAHHAEARPFLPIIDDEIARRTVMAFNGAFAAKDHALAVSLFERLPKNRISSKLRLKHLIATMPEFLALPLNAMAQAAMGSAKGNSRPPL